MKRIWMLMLVIAVVAFTNSCDEAEQTPQFVASDADFSITSSTESVAIAAPDSLEDAVSLFWADPAYAVGLSRTKFTVMIGATEKNFASFSSKEFKAVLTGALQGNEINAVALKLGGVIGQPITLDVKVIASQENNNEPKTSNVVHITVTPFGDLALLASSSSVVTKEADAANVGLTLDWNAGFKGYEGARSYQFQYAKGGTSFASPTVMDVASLTKTFTHLELNNIAALDFGVPAGSSGPVDFRVKATNGLGKVIYSNTVTVAITPYSSKPVPKFPVPDNLYIVGDATAGGWSNPAPAPSQVLTRIDDNTFGIIINLIGGKGYLLLPLNNGNWDHKYNVSVSDANPAGDAFAPDAGSNNIPAPATSGLYKIIVDFVKGTYTTTLLDTNPVEANLFIVGDATAGDWSNPVPTPSQQFTQVSNAEFQLTLPLKSGKSYLLLPVNNNNWDHKYGGTSKLSGDLLHDGAVPGSNTPSPDVDGTYLISVNFLTLKYTLTKQ